MIHVKEALDRESESFYWLSVYAADSAAVPRSSFVDVLIDVDDVNDNRCDHVLTVTSWPRGQWAIAPSSP